MQVASEPATHSRAGGQRDPGETRLSERGANSTARDACRAGLAVTCCCRVSGLAPVDAGQKMGSMPEGWAGEGCRSSNGARAYRVADAIDRS